MSEKEKKILEKASAEVLVGYGQKFQDGSAACKKQMQQKYCNIVLPS